MANPVPAAGDDGTVWIDAVRYGAIARLAVIRPNGTEEYILGEDAAELLAAKLKGEGGAEGE